MVDYNTHGGYFAPQGLMKINEGGSHEENPNGGVQLGVDGQGIPNLVEEGEMVYKDFVYSDNIKADGGFLEKNNLPKKYAGKFYSEIAEALCDEIGEQTDPISLNGLNASLGRLAGAQEEQKAAEEEAELMKALQQMSPEDLAMLEQALMEQQAPEQPMMPEEQMQPEMMPEEAAPEQIAPAVPMMEKGGKLKKAIKHFLNGPETWTAPDGNEYPIIKGFPPAVGKRVADPSKAYEMAYKSAGLLKKSWPWLAGASILSGAPAVYNSIWGDPDVEGATVDYEYDPNDFNLGGVVRKFVKGSPGEIGFIPGDRRDGFHNMSSGHANYYWDNYPVNGVKRPFTILSPSPEAVSVDYGQLGYLPDSFDGYLDNGMFIHAPSVGYPTNTFAELFNRGSLGWKEPDGDVVVVETKPVVTTTKNTTRPRGSSISKPVPIPDVQPLLSDADLDAIINGASRQPDPRGLYVGHGMYMPSELVDKVDSTNIPIKDTEINVPKLSSLANGNTNDSNSFDWRYLSPAIDAAMGIGALAAPADHYDYNPIRPYLPYGRIRQQYERYNPLDINLMTNKMQAQANATMAALRNAGIGPSTGAQMIGADAVAGQNLGNALAGVWDANNHRYNQVVNQHNAADAAKAQFDWGVDSARANALNQFAPYNQRMALQTQMLNNQAEQQKYDTIGSYIDSAKQFFANKGREDLVRNMVNTNRAFLGYGVDNMNNVVYDKNGNPVMLVACGGKINKKK